MKQSKNTAKNKLIATLILGLAITGSATSKTSAMFPNRTDTHTDTRSCTTTPEGSTETSSLTSSAQQESFFTLDDMYPVTSESNSPELPPVTSLDDLMSSSPVESYSQRISPDEQEFNEIQTRERTSLFDADRDRYSNIGSIGRQNSKRDMSLGEGEYVTKERSVINASKVIKETIGDQKLSIIATQAPKQKTISSFWDLIFSGKHVNDIVVLGNPWPETNPDIPSETIQDYWSSKAILASSKYEITRNKETEVAPAYATRYGGAKPISDSANKTVVTITNRLTGESKTVNVYNYHAWPDKELPTETSDFDNFVSMFKDTRKLVVHCSAGVGRTGTFSACLEVLRRGTTANVRNLVTEMRTCRVCMVQTPKQYSFVKEYQRRHNPADSIPDSPRISDEQAFAAGSTLSDMSNPTEQSRFPMPLTRPSTRRQSAANASALNETSNPNPLAASRAAGSTLSDMPNPLVQLCFPTPLTRPSTRRQPAANTSALNKTSNPNPLAASRAAGSTLSDMPNPVEQSRCPKP